MWHHFTLEVGANTTEDEPEEKELGLTYGIIRYIAVVHPRGCKAMVETRIYRFNHQIFPNNSDEAAKGDGVVEGGEVYYPLLEPPHVLRAIGISPGTSYPHDIPIFISVLPPEVVSPWARLTQSFSKFFKLVGVGG